MRNRTRNEVISTYQRSAHNVQANHGFTDGGSPSGIIETQAVPAYGPITSAAFSERMDDNVGKENINEVYHRRHEFRLTENEDIAFANTVGGRPCVTSYSPAHYWVDWNKTTYDLESAWNVNLNTPPPQWNITQLTSEEEMDLKSSLMERARELKADAVLNIVESNQIWPSLTSLTSCLPNMARNWNRIRKLVNTASGSYLAWKFGVSPILSDVTAIVKHLPKLVRDIDRHGQQKTFRYSTVRMLKTVFGGGVLKWDYNSTIHYSRQGRFSTTPQVRYVLAVTPNTRYNSRFFAAADLCMKRFATSPARLAWERIPFSFVADWFVDIKGCLNALDSVLGVNPFTVKGFSRSYTYDLGIDRFVDLTFPNGHTPIQSWKMYSAEYKHYERSSVSPGAYAPRWKPRFGKNQAAISAALIAQMLSQARRR